MLTINMDESGIDLEYDFYKFNNEGFDSDFMNDDISLPNNFYSDPGMVYYELKSKTVPEDSPPTFKTSTPTSRTQLKLQLQREKLQEEQKREAERRRAEETAAATQQNHQAMIGPTLPAATTAAPVNIHSFGVQVPPQVLQVKTALENPTRYHVMQKQKSQVQQYLTQSLQQIDPISHPAATASPESMTTSASEAEDIFEDLLSNVGSSHTSDNIKTAQSLTLPSVIDTGSTGMYLDHLIALGSSTTPVKTSISCPPDLQQVKSEPAQFTEADLHALAKDRQKKDNHNMIERRRRFNINDRIKELGTLLPKNNDPYFEIVRDVRPNKGTILKSSVDYIKALKHEVQKMKQVESKQRQLETQNRRLLLRIQELEHLAKAHGLHVSEFTWQPTAPSVVINTYIKNNPPLSSKMPDVLTEASTLSSAEDLMDDDCHGVVNGDPMLSSPPSPSEMDMIVQ
ncbi:transcription factor Mitf isoform X2 [Lycorma delicatula]|uniref:transcription factor Mitf isoform X2 n=1 Tax=Lycorma delicatula TaxID=130591 RepID=UPI003F510699